MQPQDHMTISFTSSELEAISSGQLYMQCPQAQSTVGAGAPRSATPPLCTRSQGGATSPTAELRVPGCARKAHCEVAGGNTPELSIPGQAVSLSPAPRPRSGAELRALTRAARALILSAADGLPVLGAHIPPNSIFQI